MGCDGCVTYLSLEHPPGEGVAPVHSREVPLPLTREEIGSPVPLKVKWEPATVMPHCGLKLTSWLIDRGAVNAHLSRHKRGQSHHPYIKKARVTGYVVYGVLHPYAVLKHMGAATVKVTDSR